MRRLVVEADGGARGNPGRAAYGALVRDADSGEVLAERSATIGIATNNVAEYSGLVAGLSAAAELDPRAQVEVRMDSKLVIEQMNGAWKIKNPGLQPLALAARDAYDHRLVTYTWVPRAQNAYADGLVNATLDATLRRPESHGSAGREPSVRVQGAGAASARAPSAPYVEGGEVEPSEAVVAPHTPRAADPVGGNRIVANRIVGWATDLGTPTTLLLLRHGETAGTLAKLFSGRGGADHELTARGEIQATLAAAAVRARGDVTAIVTSPLRRCQQTAAQVAAVTGLEPTVDDDLAEAAFGDWDGLTLAEVDGRWSAELAAWLGQTDVAPPGGESIDEVADRVAAARDRIVAAHSGQVVLVVAHVNPIKTLVRLALDAPPDAIYRMAMSPASLSEVAYYPDGTTVLRSFGGSAHLAGSGTPAGG